MPILAAIMGLPGGNRTGVAPTPARKAMMLKNPTFDGRVGAACHRSGAKLVPSRLNGHMRERLYASEPQHGPFTSWEWQVRVFRPVVQPAPHLLVITAPHVLSCGPAGPKPIRHDSVVQAMSFQDFQHEHAISGLGGDAFRHLALAGHRPPEAAPDPVDLHENRVEVPPPMSGGAHPAHSTVADFSGKHRAHPVPPELHGLVTDLDAAFMQQIPLFQRDSGNRM